MKVTVKVSEK